MRKALSCSRTDVHTSVMAFLGPVNFSPPFSPSDTLYYVKFKNNHIGEFALQIGAREKKPIENALKQLPKGTILEVHGKENSDKFVGAKFFQLAPESRDYIWDGVMDPDELVYLNPYFHIPPENEASYRELVPELEKVVDTKEKKSENMLYGFSERRLSNGNLEICVREAYNEAEALLEHLENVNDPLKELVKMSLDEGPTRVNVFAPKKKLVKLEKPLEPLNPEFYEMFDSFYGYV